MTTAKSPSATSQPQTPFRLPDPPEREPDEATRYDYVYQSGAPLHIARHLGDPDTTLVVADRWIVASPAWDKSRAKRPDLLIARNVNPALYREQNGYVVSDQGKAPDFVLEVASASTAAADVGEKRDYYEALGALEYWRFDATGEHHGERLAGDRLVDGRYRAVAIVELADGSLQGYCASLDLYLRWEAGELGWYDPATGRHIVTFDDERAARQAAEARVRELEAELRRLRND